MPDPTAHLSAAAVALAGTSARRSASCPPARLPTPRRQPFGPYLRRLRAATLHRSTVGGGLVGPSVEVDDGARRG